MRGYNINDFKHYIDYFYVHYYNKTINHYYNQDYHNNQTNNQDDHLYCPNYAYDTPDYHLDVQDYAYDSQNVSNVDCKDLVCCLMLAPSLLAIFIPCSPFLSLCNTSASPRKGSMS